MDHVYKGFDSEGFYSALATTVAAKKVTWKQVSTDTGVSASTLTRMAQGRYPDAASLAGNSPRDPTRSSMRISDTPRSWAGGAQITG